MEQEIDLREYIYVLLRYWKWIGGITLVVTVIAAVISLALPKKYTATASVIITTPRYRLNFDARFETMSIKQDYGAYLELAKSDAVLLALIENLGDELLPAQQDVPVLRGMLSAQSGQDRSFVLLRVTGNSATRVALIANTWAELLIQHANALYGQHDQDLTFFLAELQKADQELALAEQLLIEFQGRSRISVLEKQIAAKTTAVADYLSVTESGRASTVSERVKADTQALANYLALRNELRLVLQDARSLQARVQADADDNFPLATTLAALLLELDSLHAAKSPEPFQLQIPAGDLAGMTQERAALSQYLADLINSLEDKETEVARTIDEVSGQLLGGQELTLPTGTDAASAEALTAAVQELQSLQEALQHEQIELERLQIQRDLAQENYKSLARKVEESKLKAAGQEEEVRFASLAAVPKYPSAPNKKMIVAAAGALALLMTVLAVFLWEWWRGAEPAAKMG